MPQPAIDVEHRKTKLGHLSIVNGFLCVTDKGAAVLRQFDLGSGGLYPLDLVRHDGVTPVYGFFWALNIGEKNALAMEEGRAVDGPYGNDNCAPKLWVKDDDFAVTPAAPKGADRWGDARVESGFFVSPPPGRGPAQGRSRQRPSTSSVVASSDAAAPAPGIAAQSHPSNSFRNP